MKKLLAFSISAFLITVHFADAATLYMKDGTVAEGTILERNEFEIIMRVGKVPRKYYTDLIERIVEEEAKDPEFAPLYINPYQFEGIPPQKVELIVRYLEANGTRLNLQKNMRHIINTAPQDRTEELEGLLAIEGLYKVLVPIYASYYTENDLEKMIEFYESPVGQKVISVTPEIMKESLRESGRYFQEKLADK